MQMKKTENKVKFAQTEPDTTKNSGTVIEIEGAPVEHTRVLEALLLSPLSEPGPRTTTVTTTEQTIGNPGSTRKNQRKRPPISIRRAQKATEEAAPQRQPETYNNKTNNSQRQHSNIPIRDFLITHYGHDPTTAQLSILPPEPVYAYPNGYR